MRITRGISQWLIAGTISAALLSTVSARADATCGTDAYMHCEDVQGHVVRPAVMAPPSGDITFGYAHPETQLLPADQAVTAQAWDPNVYGPRVPWLYGERIALHHQFVQPFLTPAVFPELSTRLMTQGGYGSRGHGAELDQFLYLSGYYLDVYAPLLLLRESVPTSPQTLRMNLKAPLLFGRHAVTGFVGANIPTSGSWVDSGYNMMLGYAYAVPAFSIQARAGIGFDQLIAEDAGPRATSALADVAMSFGMTQHVQLMLQADGRKLIGQQGGTLRLWPGFRLYPLSEATLSFAAGAQLFLDSFTSTGQFTTFGFRRAGVFFDVGYVFF